MNSREFARSEVLSRLPATPHGLNRPPFIRSNPDIGPIVASVWAACGQAYSELRTDFEAGKIPSRELLSRIEGLLQSVQSEVPEAHALAPRIARSAQSIIQAVGKRLAYVKMTPDERNATRHQQALVYIEQNTQNASMTRQILLALLENEGRVVADGQLMELMRKNAYHSAQSVPKNILGSWLQKFKYYMPFEITRAKGEGFSLAFKTNADIHDILLTEEVEEGPTRGAEQVSQGSEMPQKELPPLQYQQALQALIEEIEENPDISKGLLPETLKALAKEMQKRGNHSMVLKFRLERIEILEGEDQAHALVTLAQICANASDYIFADEIVQRAIKHPAISQNDLINAYIAQGRILRGLRQEKNGNIEPRVQVLGKRIKL